MGGTSHRKTASCWSMLRGDVNSMPMLWEWPPGQPGALSAAQAATYCQRVVDELETALPAFLDIASLSRSDARDLRGEQFDTAAAAIAANASEPEATERFVPGLLAMYSLALRGDEWAYWWAPSRDPDDRLNDPFLRGFTHRVFSARAGRNLARSVLSYAGPSGTEPRRPDPAHLRRRYEDLRSQLLSEQPPPTFKLERPWLAGFTHRVAPRWLVAIDQPATMRWLVHDLRTLPSVRRVEWTDLWGIHIEIASDHAAQDLVSWLHAWFERHLMDRPPPVFEKGKIPPRIDEPLPGTVFDVDAVSGDWDAEITFDGVFVGDNMPLIERLVNELADGPLTSQAVWEDKERVLAKLRPGAIVDDLRAALAQRLALRT